MSETRVFVVEPEAGGTRLDVFLVAHFGDTTRSRLRHWIDEGRVRVGTRTVKAGLALTPGDEIAIDVPDVVESNLEPDDRPLTIVHQDADLAVIEKPAGLAVHWAPGLRGSTLVNVLLARLDGLSGVGGVERPGIVHRLDKDTTGLMVIAKNDRAHEALRTQFHDREVEKIYLALVLGRPAQREGLFDLPIGRHPTDRKRMSTTSSRGRSARTRWKRLEDLPASTLLEVQLETGRTHQIRAHLADAGHPIVGDAVYGFGPRVRGVSDPRARSILATAARPMLHASRLSFRHPADGRRLTFESAPTADMSQLIERLRALAVLRSSGGPT